MPTIEKRGVLLLLLLCYCQRAKSLNLLVRCLQQANAGHGKVTFFARRPTVNPGKEIRPGLYKFLGHVHGIHHPRRPVFVLSNSIRSLSDPRIG